MARCFRIERGTLTAMEEFVMKRGGKHLAWLGLLILVLVPSLSSLLQAQQKSQDKAQKEPEPMKLKVGDTAPDFTLLAFDGKELKKVSLHDYKGKKNVALAFFVFAFTGG
jgi:cytochrome oxidase Cu insertion factor (SCO1/SenC/PrrC family)